MKNSLAIVALALVSAYGFGQERINLSQLSAEALKNHPRIVAMQADRDAAKARREMSVSMFRPQLSVNGYGATGNGSMIFPSAVDPINYSMLGGGSTGVINATLMWKLFTFGRDAAIASAGDAEVRLIEAQIQTEILDVLLELRNAFADAQYKMGALDAQISSKESAAEVERITQVRFEAGKVPEAFVLRAKADTARMQREVAMARVEAASSLAMVWEAAGQRPNSLNKVGDWDQVQVAIPQTMESATAAALQMRSEIKALNWQANSVRSKLLATTKSKLPELDLMVMNDVMSMRGSRVQSGFKAGVVLSFPLGDGGRRSAETKEQRKMLAAIAAQHHALENKIASEVSQAWAEWSAVSEVKAAADAEFKASDEAYRVALIRYQEGKSILAELTDARSQLTHARLSVAEATQYERKSSAKLARAVGSLS